jgi:purine-binding chemotaxis protein CheW
VDTDELQLVVCLMGEEKLAFDIGHVASIVRVPRITQVPGMPSFIEGIINLRGDILPIMDLGLRLGHNSVTRSDATRIIVLDLDNESLGVLVDAVSQVSRVSVEDVEEDLSTIYSGENVLTGIAKHEESLVMVVDPSQLLAGMGMDLSAQLPAAN